MEHKLSEPTQPAKADRSEETISNSKVSNRICCHFGKTALPTIRILVKGERCSTRFLMIVS